MLRYFTANGSRRCIDMLQKFLVSYNKSQHRSIGMAPEKVNFTNQEEVWQALYGGDFIPIKSEQKFKLELNDPVHIRMTTRPFRKGYLPQWTDEVFTLSERHSRIPPVYTLKDYSGETIEGTFYENELQKVSKQITPIALSDWEVGLAEFIYLHQYNYTIDGEHWLIKVIEPGFYDSFDAILHALKTDYSNIQYHYNQYTRKLRINLLKGAQVKFQGRLAEILGFKRKTLLTESTTIPHPVDNANIHNPLVYCDIVEPSVLGHVKVPLLRVINVNGNYGETKRDIFHHIFYHPIKQKYIDKIEIDVKDNTGCKIPFVFGNMIAILHFRLRKSPHFI
ncbi:hypothetical protein HOLleu_42158 [Holothuria leucospilota]|uniref:Integrase catalytic domain-containing protein n=1 Tax=Holothuria leucospilota TaxID=206669 RepID=A0A9Q0YD44_HOLLE|nr:hypothetical protein HOLleu_42158 [Holothuria leucospilota]